MKQEATRRQEGGEGGAKEATFLAFLGGEGESLHAAQARPLQGR